MSELFSSPDSEYQHLSDSTVAMQIINSCTIDAALKKEALYDISKMQSDYGYATLVSYRNDRQIGFAFNWFCSDLGGDFWQRVWEQLNNH